MIGAMLTLGREWIPDGKVFADEWAPLAVSVGVGVVGGPTGGSVAQSVGERVHALFV